MQSELTNLLPSSNARTLARRYFMRCATVFILLTTLAVIAHGIFLIPTYVYARGEVVREQTELDALTQKLASENGSDTGKRTAAIQTDVQYLSRLDGRPTASGAIRAVLAVAHPGIHISGFTITAPATTDAQMSMVISGVSDTRDALRSYVGALGQLPSISKADLPISTYAKETNIPFTITLTGTLTP